MMDTMDMIGHLTVYTVHEPPRRIGGDLVLGRYISLLGWMVGCGCCIYV